MSLEKGTVKEKELSEFVKPKATKMPHTYVIIFGVVLLCYLLTFVIPVGKFDTTTAKYIIAGKEKSRSVLIPESFRYKYDLNEEKLKANLATLVQDQALLDQYELDAAVITELMGTDEKTWDEGSLEEAGLSEKVIYGLYKTDVYDTTSKIKMPTKFWGTDDFNGFGVMNYVFEGLVTGDKKGSAVGIVAFILVIGGSFGIMLRTGAIDAGILSMIQRTKGREILVIPALFLAFSLAGAVFGASESVIPFVFIVVPLTVAMGYDAITGVCITFVASQIGQGASWMNPFGIAIAQGIAGIPVLSGATFRITMWVICTAVGIAFTLWYAMRIKKTPQLSVSYESDAHFRNEFDAKKDLEVDFRLGHKLVILTLFAGVTWIVWGVVAKNYYIPEIASQFFAMGLLSGIIGVVFKLNDMGLNDIASSFSKGASDLVGAAIVVGMAKGILLVLGGSSATTHTVLNTILMSTGNALQGLPPALTAWFMYVFQTIFNFFVTSGSGQAALTMPILAPLSDLVGVTRQVACLAYQLGAGFADAIVPTSASLMAVLGAARIDWMRWAKFQIKMQAVLFAVGSVFMIVAVSIGFS